MITGVQFGSTLLAFAFASTGVLSSAPSTFLALPQKDEAGQSRVLEQEELIKTYRSMPIEKKVQNYFSDIPILAAVAKCESQTTHATDDGELLRGIVNPKDVGVMQINESIHSKRAKELGYNIYTLEGNLAYARFLYEEFGLSPWSASKRCWIPHLAMLK